MTPAEVNVSYILNYLVHRPPSVPIRTFVDEWFAYHRGGVFLNRNGAPRWFNNPNPVTQREALSQMHFVSDAAQEVLDGESDSRLIKEHAVPVKVLKNLLCRIEEPTHEKVEECLLANYKLGVLTKTEDLLLNSMKLSSSMPLDWDGSNVWARYEVAGICGQETGF